MHAITVWQDPEELTRAHPRGDRRLPRLRHRSQALNRLQPEPGRRACRARLGVQLRRPHRLAQPHDAVQGEGRQGHGGGLGRALRLSEPDGGRHSRSTAPPMCRSARTRSSISSWRATSPRNSTTISPMRSPARAMATAFFPLPEPLIIGAGDAGDEPARRHQEDVEVGPFRSVAHQSDRRRRHHRRRKSARPRPIPSRCRARQRASKAGRRPRIWSPSTPRSPADRRRRCLREFGGSAVLDLQDGARRPGGRQARPDRRRDEAPCRRSRPYRRRPCRRRRAGARHRRAHFTGEVKKIVGFVSA